jgi:molecular chaperone DnaK
LREAIDKDDYDAIRTRTEDLEKAMAEIAQMAYGAAGAPPGAQNGAAGERQPSGGASKGDDDVIDAEFEETN